MNRICRLFLAGAAIVCMAVGDVVDPPTTIELKRWASEVPPDIMKRWLTTMPPGSLPEDAVKRALANPEALKSLRVEEDIKEYPLPKNEQIDSVERALSHRQCIGDLKKWARRYSFSIDYKTGHVDGNAIWFSFREAGRYGFHSGRQVGKPRDFAEVDDRQFMIAFGTYYLAEQRLKLDDCGNNHR